MAEHLVGVGVIGMGGIGAVHAVLMNALPGASLRAVVDSDTRLMGVASHVLPNVDFLTNYNDLLSRDDISLLLICTPPMTHEHILKSVLAKSHLRGIFVEKPLSTDHAGTQRMNDVAKSKGVVTAVGFQKRFNPLFRRVKNILESSLLGDIAYVRASSFSRGSLLPATGWRGDRESGGVLLDWGIHAIDLVCWLLGPIRVMSAQRVAHFSSQVEDYAAALIESPTGVAGLIEVGWSARNYLPPGITVELHGRNGMLKCTEHELSLWMDRRPGGREEVTVHTETTLAQDLDGPVPFLYGPVDVIHQDEALITSCNTGKWGGATFEDSCSVGQVIDSIRAKPLTSVRGP